MSTTADSSYLHGKMPRLILLCSGRDPDVFREIARGASLLHDRYNVRVEVSGLSCKNFAILDDPNDPYLEYKANTANLFNFSVPDEVSRFVDEPFVKDNIQLMTQKIGILREFGLRAAFCGNEPMYMPEEFYQERPEWRGPRVDHPWRSNTPRFAMCFHRLEVQELYRRTVRQLVERFPEIDTFWLRVNDSGSGFSWHPHLYFGANGSADTKSADLARLHHNFHEAILGGARDAGAQTPLCVAAMSTDDVNYAGMPDGAFRQCKARPGLDGVFSISSDIADTYPVRRIWDPLRLLEELEQMKRQQPAVVVCWLNDVYYRTDTDPQTLQRIFSLWAEAEKSPTALNSHAGRMTFLREFANREYGDGLADKVTDAWVKTHDVHRLQRMCVDGRFTRYLPYYACVSHRWLTRPLVPFPQELTREEEEYFLPHVWSPYGDESRRSRLMDYHGSSCVSLEGPYKQRSTYMELLAAGYTKAAKRYTEAADLASGEPRMEFLERAKAEQLMACLWRTCCNTMEFGLLLIKGVEGDPQGKNAPVWSFPEFADPTREYRRCLFEVMRREADNVEAIRLLLKDGAERILWLATEATGEDTFTLGPDILDQLEIKREAILRHLPDIMRLQLAASDSPTWQQ